jgi:DNA-directed RNA polymerase
MRESIFSSSPWTILTTLSVVAFLDFLIFINAFQITFAQHVPPQSRELLVVNSITNSSNVNDATVTGLDHSNKTVKQLVTSNIDKISDHYPTVQEKGRIDKIVNHTLGMLKLMMSAINNSYNCIREAVICSGGNTPNVMMLRL